MRNLQQVRHTVQASTCLSCVCFRKNDLVTLQLDGDSATVAITGDETFYAQFDVPVLPGNVNDKIVDMHYHESEDQLYIIMFGGDIIVVNLDTRGGRETVEIVGTIDEKILAASWSPDNEVLAVATQSTLNLLTQEFETLSKIDMEQQNVRLTKNQISVGWGRAETQFRGKRAARDPTLPDSVDSGKLSSQDSGRLKLSWRGDAEYISMSRISEDRRVIWIFTRDGVLESTSEPVDEQLDFVAWKPDGSLLTCLQSQQGKNVAIHFEKNGLRHGEFNLRTESRVQDLLWNCDSTILAVLYADSLDLWTCSNYHYYLKLRIPLASAGQLKWHSEDALRLLWFSVSGHIELQLRWQCATHDICQPHDYGVVAVIDGHRLALTPLRLAKVPPPMSHQAITLSAVPCDVAITGDTKSLAVLYDTKAQIFRWNLSESPADKPELLGQVDLPVPVDIRYLQIVWTTNNEAFVLDSSSNISRIRIEAQEIHVVTVIGPSNVRSLYAAHGSLIFQRLDGEILCSSKADITPVITEQTNVYDSMDIWNLQNDSKRTLIGLTREGTLFIQGRRPKTKVTSYILIGSIVAYTRSTDLILLDLCSDKDDTEDDENSRTIERGSILICACPTTQSVVLQAARGNLETIYPRQLVITSLQRMILAGQWSSAWKLSKVHRINPNFLYDFSPTRFTANVSGVVMGMGTSSELDIFLTGLVEDNVCKTMYPKTNDSAQADELEPHKINTICDAILAWLRCNDSTLYFNSILTALLCKRPPSYEQALILTGKMPLPQREDAITHLCFLADPQMLYRQALGIYDLHSALLLAQKSQKDPREYVPFLQRLQTMSISRQRFTLDDHLGHFSKAIRSLLEIQDAWEECMLYTDKHDLWLAALQIVRHDPDRHHKLLKLYGEHLFELHDFADAGFAFEQVKDFDRAADAFERAGYWIESLHNASLANKPLEELAGRLRDHLIEQARYFDAAQISRHYLSEPDVAISLYCRAYKFSDAMQVAGSQQRIEATVKPLVVESFAQTSEFLSEMRSQLEKQLPRLRDVRSKRQNNLQDGFVGNDDDDDTPDNVSLADTLGTTNASFFTRYTGASALTTQSKKSGKARRRQERQRAKGKKGTIWEEEYLIGSTRRLIERLENDRKDIKNLVVALFRCDLSQNATELQSAAMALIGEIKQHIDEVFTAEDGLPEELRRLTTGKPYIADFEPFRFC